MGKVGSNLLDESIDEIEREKALVLLNSRHRPVVNTFLKKIANGVAAFWKSKRVAEREGTKILWQTQLHS